MSNVCNSENGEISLAPIGPENPGLLKMAGHRPASRLKTRKQQRLSKKNENDENGGEKLDEAELKKPIETSVIGLLKALNVLQNGSSEVKEYLSNECDIIYECRVCRSLFRSLANFILHKRTYCQDAFSYHHRRYLDDEQLFINSERGQSTGAEEVQEKPKDLASIIDRLGKRNCNKSEEIPFSDDFQIKNILSLQNMEESSVSMFQTITENNPDQTDSEYIKTELMELYNMEEDAGAVLGPDGRCLGFRSETTSPVNENTCEQCHQTFSTRKTLRFHMNTKHNESRIVYPCTDCNETFVNPWGVYRHLLSFHRRTSKEIKKLRNQIQSSFHPANQAPVRKQRTDPVLAELTEQERLQENNKEWITNLECGDSQRCGGCGRRFERKAALHSHSLMCQKRIAALRSGESIVKTKNKKGVKKKDEIKTEDVGRISRKNSTSSIVDTLKLSDEETYDETPTKDPLADENDTKPPETVDVNSNDQNDAVQDLLSIRMKPFINVGRKYVCTRCENRYGTLPLLRRHMAVHFNWNRFRCLRCDFKCFDKREAIVHAQSLHNATLDVIKTFIVRMSEAESDKYSSQIFLPINTTPQLIITLDDSDEEKQVLDDDSDRQEDVKDIGEDSQLSRNMIMEIIGYNEPPINVTVKEKRPGITPPSSDLDETPPSTMETTQSEETSLSIAEVNSTSSNSITKMTQASSRPVRNRVKPVNKDFIYDMSAFSRDESYEYNSKSKRRVETSPVNPAPSEQLRENSEMPKKKRRRSSKVFSTNNEETLRIVPVEYIQSGFTSPEEASVVSNNSSNSSEEVQVDKEMTDTSPAFLIHSVMSVDI